MGRLNGCCCCFNLEDGARAVGITFLVLACLGMVCQIGVTIHIALLLRENVYLTSAGMAQIVIGFIFIILHIIFNSLLVHGVNNSRRGLVLAWIIYSGIILGLQSVGVAIGFVFACVSGVWWLILLVLGVAALIGVFWYWFVVVVHYHQDMTERNGTVYGKQGIAL